VAALEAQAARSQQQTQVRLLRQRAGLQAQALELERLRNRQQVAALVALVALVLAVARYLATGYSPSALLHLQGGAAQRGEARPCSANTGAPVATTPSNRVGSTRLRPWTN
jgi:hypothetical protein